MCNSEKKKRKSKARRLLETAQEPVVQEPVVKEPGIQEAVASSSLGYGNSGSDKQKQKYNNRCHKS